MKTIFLLFFFQISVGAYAQTELEIKKMLKSRKYEIDSNYQQIISLNKWQFIYRYDKTLFKRKWKEISYTNSFEIQGQTIKYTFPNKPNSNNTAEVYFEDYRLIIKDSEEEITYYDIVDIIDDTYFVLEVVRLKGFRGSILKTPRIRLLYKKIEE